MHRVFTIPKVLVAVITAITLTACHSDETFPPVAEDLVGTWDRYYADSRVVEDGSVTYTLNADGTCCVEVYTIFQMPDGTDTFFHQGTWAYDSEEHALTIVTNCWSNSDAAFDESKDREEETSTLRLRVFKFRENKFSAMTEGNTELIFRRR
ncbi:MAG: hypothetical protein LUC85_01725 [Bacteroidales bacterium]|nr:hypothetical protein [Bacteroidales bacterium]